MKHCIIHISSQQTILMSTIIPVIKMTVLALAQISEMAVIALAQISEMAVTC